jgi:hypothetical protein
MSRAMEYAGNTQAKSGADRRKQSENYYWKVLLVQINVCHTESESRSLQRISGVPKGHPP